MRRIPKQFKNSAPESMQYCKEYYFQAKNLCSKMYRAVKAADIFRNSKLNILQHIRGE